MIFFAETSKATLQKLKALRCCGAFFCAVISDDAGCLGYGSNVGITLDVCGYLSHIALYPGGEVFGTLANKGSLTTLIISL
jgi:hypothetical protein